MYFLGVIMIQVLYFVFCVSKPLLVCHVVCSSSKNLNQTYWDPWSCCLFFQTPLGLRGNLKYPMSMLQYYFHRTQQHDICLSNYQLNLGIKFFGPCFFWRSTNILTKTVHFWFVTGRKNSSRFVGDQLELEAWSVLNEERTSEQRVPCFRQLPVFCKLLLKWKRVPPRSWTFSVKMDGWKMNFPFGKAYFQVQTVSFREGIYNNEKCKWHKSYGAWSIYSVDFWELQHLLS